MIQPELEVLEVLMHKNIINFYHKDIIYLIASNLESSKVYRYTFFNLITSFDWSKSLQGGRFWSLVYFRSKFFQTNDIKYTI